MPRGQEEPTCMYSKAPTYTSQSVPWVITAVFGKCQVNVAMFACTNTGVSRVLEHLANQANKKDVCEFVCVSCRNEHAITQMLRPPHHNSMRATSVQLLKAQVEGCTLSFRPCEIRKSKGKFIRRHPTTRPAGRASTQATFSACPLVFVLATATSPCIIDKHLNGIAPSTQFGYD